MYPEAVHQIMAMMSSLMGWQLLNPAKIIKEPRFLFWNFRCARRNRFFDPLRKGNHFLTLQNLYRNLLNIFKDKINVEAKYLNIEKIYKTSMNINIQATGYGGIVRSIVYVFVHIKKKTNIFLLDLSCCSLSTEYRSFSLCYIEIVILGTEYPRHTYMLHLKILSLAHWSWEGAGPPPF